MSEESRARRWNTISAAVAASASKGIDVGTEQWRPIRHKCNVYTYMRLCVTSSFPRQRFRESVKKISAEAPKLVSFFASVERSPTNM